MSTSQRDLDGLARPVMGLEADIAGSEEARRLLPQVRSQQAIELDEMIGALRDTLSVRMFT